MARELREWIAIEMGGKVGAHRVAAFFANVLGAALRVQPRHLLEQHVDLIGCEEARKEQIAFALEPLELLPGEFHGLLLRAANRRRTRQRMHCFLVSPRGNPADISSYDSRNRNDRDTRRA